MLSIKLITNSIRWSWLGWIIFFILLAAPPSAYFAFEKINEKKIYPKTYIGEINLGGKTREEALIALNKKMDGMNQNGIIFYYNDKKATVYPLVSSPEGDIARQIINFNAENAINEAFGYGRSGNFLIDLEDKIKIAIFKKQIALPVDINEEEIIKKLSDDFSQFDAPAQDAKLTFIKNLSFEKYPDYPVNFSISEEKLGKIIDYDKAIKQLAANLSVLNDSSIRLLSKTDYPEIYKKDCLNVESEAEKILSLAPLTLKLCGAEQNSAAYSVCEIPGKKEWVIEKKQLADWLVLKKDGENKIKTGLNPELIKQFIKENISPDVDQQPRDAKFEIKDGRVIEFQASRDGWEVGAEETFKKIGAVILEINAGKKEIELAIKETKSSIRAEEINNLGIREIIGTGESNFTGSPANRRHNIKTGAAALNGVLIKPGEEFSLVKTLGKIDALTGYLPELVIKENKTTPEYGGGLCQIGTTMFRAALASGLPITARRNHSYRVSYYEPAGTDATIYDPYPDLRFINDTPNYILIQRRIEGDNLYFDFWGTKDGRIVGKTKPTIYNIVKPGPAKLIETLNLKPGEKKCTEKPHNGADAYFDYKVVYPNNETREKRFSSHYVPWREVCLIGVEKLSDAGTENNNATPATPLATSTILNINQ
ncbi:VanW family protein [Candidatus Falkowbacteria bacterium]|nr:VanW family protein [Candidatus Falkowbacteria bacterium]